MAVLASNKGQGVIESIIALPLLFLAGTILTLILYRSMVHFYSDYQLHEALICAQSESLRICESELKKRIRTILITKNPYEVQITKNAGSLRGRVRIEFEVSNLTARIPSSMEIQKTLHRN